MPSGLPDAPRAGKRSLLDDDLGTVAVPTGPGELPAGRIRVLRQFVVIAAVRHSLRNLGRLVLPEHPLFVFERRLVQELDRVRSATARELPPDLVAGFEIEGGRNERSVRGIVGVVVRFDGDQD